MVEEHKVMLLDERARDISLGITLVYSRGFLSAFFPFPSLYLPPLLCIHTQSLNIAAEGSGKQPPVDLGVIELSSDV